MYQILPGSFGLRIRILQRLIIAKRTTPRTTLHKNNNGYLIRKIDDTEFLNIADSD
jgi:hypothetical protein